MFKELLIKINRELQASSIPYMVIGGQAVLLYGEPRLTRDVDITLGVDLDELPQLLKITKKIGATPLLVDVKKFVEETYVLPLRDKKSGIRIDFIFSFTPYEQQAIKRANLVKIGKNFVSFASVEDVIIHKLIAGRSRDIEDFKNIVLKTSNIDVTYVQKWLKEFDNLFPEKKLLSAFLSGLKQKE